MICPPGEKKDSFQYLGGGSKKIKTKDIFRFSLFADISIKDIRQKEQKRQRTLSLFDLRYSRGSRAENTITLNWYRCSWEIGLVHEVAAGSVSDY